MSKRRNRQPDANGDATEDSTESGEEINTAGKCPHIAKAINVNNVKKNLKKTGIATECSACNQLETNSPNETGADVSSPPLWICLRCGHQGCGRLQGQHALKHYQKPHSDCHCIAIDTHQWCIWCYQCEMEISTDLRMKLRETVKFMKKSASTPHPVSQPKMPVILCQKEINDIDKDKQKTLYNFPKVGGLANLGNTCFFNAVLQCLAQTPFLVKVLDDLRLPGQKFVLPGGQHKTFDDAETVDLPPIEGTLEQWGNFTSILCKTLTEMQSSNGHQTYKPTELLSTFKKKTMKCMDGGQHDSHELLRHLLELVRNEDLRRYQSIILKEVGLSEKTKPECVEDNMKSRVKFYGHQASARLLGPDLVFRGILVSTLECLDCHHSSQRTEPFLDLSLPVMADKPQPPVLKRKNSGFEDTFDMMGNHVFNPPWKALNKKEKKLVRKSRRNVKNENQNTNDTSSNQNNSIEDNNGSILKPEDSDADVEDNIEIEGSMPEVGESGYSSEKVSAVASPVSPSDHRSSDQSIESPNINSFSVDNELVSSINNLNSVQTSADTASASPNDIPPAGLSKLKYLYQLKLFADRTENSGSPENENGVQSGFPLSTALAINSDIATPEAPTESPLSSSITSKESPTSPLSSIMNGDNAGKVERPASRLDLVESVVHKAAEDSGSWTSELGQEQSKGFSDMNTEKINLLCTTECLEASTIQQESCNGVNEITCGLSKLGIANSTHQSPTRYPAKEGECSIQSCLNQFTALELMSGSNKVRCEACTAREKKAKGESTKMVCTPSTKQYLMSRVPAVLILHLKRFQAQRVSFRKVTKHVTFPTLLDLSPVCKGHDKPRVYALYGVVEHSGTLHGGHYVAYVKTRMPLSPDDSRWSFLPAKDAREVEETSSGSSSESEEEEATAKASPIVEPPPGRWYYISDSRVTEVDESTVLQTQAYLLFYERIL